MWDPSDIEAQECGTTAASRVATRFPTWTQTFFSKGMQVFSFGAETSMSRVYPVANSSGVVLGIMFSRKRGSGASEFTSLDRLSATESSCLVEYGPSWLVDNVWGFYVAFVKNARSNSMWVLRGPMSDVGCHQLSIGNVNIFASKADDLATLRLRHLSIDWSMTQLLVGTGQAYPMGQSAIAEIHSLQGGEAVTISNGVAANSLVWDPRRLVKEQFKGGLSDLTHEMKATTKACIHAWASLHPRIVHRLSGGLDSSVVLHCLARSPSMPKVTCVNYYWEGKQIDERVFARSIAAHADAKLVEMRFGTCHHFDVIKDASRTAAPVIDLIDWQMHDAEQTLIAECGATAVFGGWLGDSLFERDVAVTAAADYLRLFGIDKRFFAVSMDLAIRHGFSLWAVLGSTLRDYLKPQKRRYWSIYEDCLSAGFLNDRQMLISDEDKEDFFTNLQRYAHPWLKDLRRCAEQATEVITAACLTPVCRRVLRCTI